MNNKILYFLIIISFCVFIFPKYSEAAMLRLNLFYDNGSIIWDKDVLEKIHFFENLYFAQPRLEGKYTVEIYSSENEIIARYKQNLQPVLMIDVFDPQTSQLIEGGAEKLDQGPIKVDAPYEENISHLIIFNEFMEEVFQADLSSFARIEEEPDAQPADVAEEPQKPDKKHFTVYWILLGLLCGAFLIYFIIKIKSSKNKQG